MLNVNELTSRLAKMSDEQLRQYARLHKDDPYILALASSESKQRVEVRAAGQQFAQQPTIAEQRLAQMGAPAPMPQQTAAPQPQLPEQQGIGMLPAKNVEGMADGGIAGYGDPYADEYASGGMVAFESGGSVFGPSFADIFSKKAREDLDKGEYKTSPMGRLFSFLTPDAYTTDTRNQLLDIDKKYSVLRNEYKNLTGAFGFRSQSPQEQVRASELEKQMAALEQQSSAIRSRPDATVRAAHEQRVAAAQSAPEQFQAPLPVEREAGWAVKGKKKGEKSSYPAPIDEGNVYTGRDTAAPFNLKTDAGKKAATNRPGTGTTTGPSTEKAPDFVPSQPGDLTAELKRLQSMNPGTKAYDDLSTKIKQGYADLEKAREAGKPKDKAYAGLEALLNKEEEKAKGREARNFNMAIVNSGLAIAGGESQYALQNIAKGAQVGTKQYQEGLEKLEAAALERRKQSAMIEEARRAEARGDWKDAQQFKQKAFEADLSVKQAQIAAVQDLYKTDLKTAADIVNNQNTLAAGDRRTIFEQQQQNIRAREQNVSAERVAGIYANSRLGGLGARGQITPALVLKEYNDLVAKDTLGDFQKKYPTPQHYMAAIEQMMNPTIVSELPQNANVRR